MSIDLLIDRIAAEIKFDKTTIENKYTEQLSPRFQDSAGRRISLKEFNKRGLEESPIGGLHICYIKDRYLTVDRILPGKSGFSKSRRILYDLNTKPGQIGSSLMLELLKIENGEAFSKHKFIRGVEEEYFINQNIHVQTSDLTEVLSRMFRKTLTEFFGIKGRYFERSNFLLKMTELPVDERKKSYLQYKSKIDNHANTMLYALNNVKNVNIQS